MKTPAEYRELAEDCVRLACTASTVRQRVVFLSIANTWLQLAEEVHDNPAIEPEERAA